MADDLGSKKPKKAKKGSDDADGDGSPDNAETEQRQAEAAATAEGNSLTVGFSRKTFAELPLSRRTLEGLETYNKKNMTDIQRAALPHALAGRDVLGAAKTGSGKTLAFIIPVRTLSRSFFFIIDVTVLSRLLKSCTDSSGVAKMAWAH